MFKSTLSTLHSSRGGVAKQCVCFIKTTQYQHNQQSYSKLLFAASTFLEKSYTQNATFFPFKLGTIGDLRTHPVSQDSNFRELTLENTLYPMTKTLETDPKAHPVTPDPNLEHRSQSTPCNL
ncbi:hypothetical protein RRG08_013244 [Elysia crispata]|uniref:Uncharacterized protein n=1 Tax=Elysia crispata TaxID=231223 RepID=A0AAE0Z5E9_9GAST|nr:hypothetical protein RRG08_013244 [Elysia crispata]